MDIVGYYLFIVTLFTVGSVHILKTLGLCF